MKLATQSELQHHHTVLNADRDGLTELMVEIRCQKSTGKMTVNFNQGGITSVTFEEKKRVSQHELDEWDRLRGLSANGNGHLSTRGEIRVIDGN